MDWSIRADNFQGTDLVVRLVEDGEASYLLLPNESDALIVGGKGSPPRTVSVTSLDPVSCRPVGEVTDLPGEHTRVSVSWGGAIDSGTYDPRDVADDWGLSDRLAPTDTCSDSDPSATLAPPPSLLTGDWLNG
jgi:hypothetical protein